MFSKKDWENIILFGLLGPFAIPLIALNSNSLPPKRKPQEKKAPFNPIKYVIDPVRMLMKNPAIRKKLEEGGFTEEQRQKLLELKQKGYHYQGFVYFFIKSISFDQKNQKEEKILMAGWFPQSSQVTKILGYLRKQVSYLSDQSVQFFCNGKLVPLNTRLNTLPKNEIEAVELYIVNMEAFG